MKKKQGYCSACHQNKPHRRLPGLFSILNLLMLGIPGLFGISTWSCTHCNTECICLRRRRERPQIDSSANSRKGLPEPPPNGGLLSSPEEARQGEIPIQRVGNIERTDRSLVVQTVRSRLYSDKYRDGVVKRILSGITSIAEVRESLGLSEADVIDWIKQSFQRKEDRVEELRGALKLYQQNNPDAEVGRLVAEIERSELTRAASRAVQLPVAPKARPNSLPDHFLESAINTEAELATE